MLSSSRSVLPRRPLLPHAATFPRLSPRATLPRKVSAFHRAHPQQCPVSEQWDERPGGSARPPAARGARLEKQTRAPEEDSRTYAQHPAGKFNRQVCDLLKTTHMLAILLKTISAKWRLIIFCFVFLPRSFFFFFFLLFVFLFFFFLSTTSSGF